MRLTPKECIDALNRDGARLVNGLDAKWNEEAVRWACMYIGQYMAVDAAERYAALGETEKERGRELRALRERIAMLESDIETLRECAEPPECRPVDAATLGGGECEMVTSGTPCTGNTDKRCTSCGASNIGEYYDGQDHVATTPRFCPNCGRKVKR